MTHDSSTPTAPSTGEVLLRLTDVTKTFGGVQALRGVSLDLHAGEVYHLLGENGSGKSTLIKIISGAQPPSGGTITVRGRTYRRLRALDALEAGIETVYQDLSLFPNLSVAENVALSSQLVRGGGRLARPLDPAEVRRVASEALTRVGLPTSEDFLDTAVDELPIAVRQLVAIARSTVIRASLVIMDEPTAALTQREVENLIGIVDRLRADGVSVLFVTHKLDEAYRIGGNLVVLRDGQKVAQGRLADHTKAEVAYLMTGQTLDRTTYRAGSPQEEILLEVSGLTRRGAFSDVSFTLRRGEVLGVTGLLDSGRNELAHALSGVRPADAGKMRVGGRDARLRSPRDAIDLGVGYVPEDRLTEGLFLEKSIRENMIVSVLDRLLGRARTLSAERAERLAGDLVRDLRVATPNVELPVQSLSGGNQQRVLVARWLATRPRVLILHGPTMGVDVGSKDALYRLVQDLAQRGLGVLIVSDDLPELLMNCDRVLVMRHGRVAREFSVPGLDEATLTRELLDDRPLAPSPAPPGGLLAAAPEKGGD
ncbi:sugar ABC transporter ATP-binding protein [Deinococcus pimensis]|uniref:sugar ABC transporter ATP-binding protein n=1 Tax=Deinococcus pimensis TaxID=309888 RepID=UPI0004B41468|nr:sugar ABC transporter ATP-binding protein [Deinococcus pimensis]